jgi:hypothetical protein
VHAVTDPEVCPNCETTLAPGQQFCGRCGQKVSSRRLTLGGIGDELVHALFHLDHSILALLKGLLVRPGRVARDYVEGRRKRYFGPFGFLVVTAGLATFFVAIWGAQWFSPITDSNAQAILTRHINLVILLQTPVLTLLCLLLFWKQRLNFAEHLVLAAYTAGMRMLYMSFVAVPLMRLTGRTAADPAFVVGYYGAWLAYFAVAATQFYQGKRWVLAFKAVVAGLVNQLLTMVGIYIFIYTYEFASH